MGVPISQHEQVKASLVKAQEDAVGATKQLRQSNSVIAKLEEEAAQARVHIEELK